MLNAAVAADGFLIGPRVEKTDILRSSPQFRQKDRIRVRLPVVIVLAVAGQPSEENPLVLAVPVIDGEQNVPLVDPPDVGQRRHERAVDHIPALAIVLLLLVDDREKRRAALADGKRSELGEDVRLVDSGLIAYVLDLGDDLLGNVLVVVVESERVLDRETASDIQRVELRADFLQLAINVQTLAQLIPVVRGILDSGIDEKVQHLEPEFLVPLDFRTIILDDIVITDTQSRRIEIELRLLLRGDPDTDFAPGIDRRVEQLELLLIIDDRNRILKAAVDQRGDVFDILRTLESVAYGAASGVMLGSVLLIFSCFNRIITDDKILYLFGRIIPSLAVVISMALRFVPLFTTQAKKIALAQRCSDGDPASKSIGKRAKSGLFIFSALITWALESAVTTADSMRARGFGLHPRSFYTDFRFDGRDTVVSLFLAAGIAIFGTAAGCGKIAVTYFPKFRMNPASPLFIAACIAYALTLLIPVIMNIKESVAWHCLKSKI